MHRVGTWVVGLMLGAALPLAAADSTRLRLENPGKEGRVEVVIADRSPTTFEVRTDGMAGEVLVVEAPSPDIRLGGGSISSDPLLEALVNQQVNRSRARPSRVIIIPSSEGRFVARQLVRPLYGFTDADLFFAPPLQYYRSSSNYSCTQRSIRQAPRVRAQSTRSTRGSFTARAAIPRH